MRRGRKEEAKHRRLLRKAAARSNREMWLFRGHRLEKCCCGRCFVDVDYRNVAVALISCASAKETLLW